MTQVTSDTSEQELFFICLSLSTLDIFAKSVHLFKWRKCDLRWLKTFDVVEDIFILQEDFDNGRSIFEEDFDNGENILCNVLLCNILLFYIFVIQFIVILWVSVLYYVSTFCNPSYFSLFALVLFCNVLFFAKTKTKSMMKNVILCTFLCYSLYCCLRYYYSIHLLLNKKFKVLLLLFFFVIHCIVVQWMYYSI